MVGKPANSKNCDHNDKHFHNLKKNQNLLDFEYFFGPKLVTLHFLMSVVKRWWYEEKSKKKGGKNLRTKIRFGKVWYNAFHCAKVVFYTNGLSLFKIWFFNSFLSFEDQSLKIGTFTKGTFKKKVKKKKKKKGKEITFFLFW